MTKIKPHENLQSVENGNLVFQPRYDLSPEELNVLERDVVKLVKENFPGEEMVAVWINPQSPYADFVRTHEAKYFEEVQEVSEDDERHTMFLALVDMRDSGNRIVHAATASGVIYNQNEKEIIEQPDMGINSTGFITVDSLIEMGNFTAQDFYDYYESKGINLQKSIAIETNFKIGRMIENYRGFGTAELAYLSIYRLWGKRAPEYDKAILFATINSPQVSSIRRVGLECNPLMNMKQLITPESLLGKDSHPVEIPYSKDNCAIFESMDLRLSELYI